MASPHLSSAHHSTTQTRRDRRSAFNGAKQLTAAGASNRRILFLVGLLGVLLISALVVVAVHLAGGA